MKVFESGITAQVDRIPFIIVTGGRVFLTFHILVRYEYYALSYKRAAVWKRIEVRRRAV